MRRLIGYGRYESEAALAQLNRVYDLLRVWTNFWQPSLKLVAKERDAATGKTRKKYDTAQTPYRRLLASGVLDEAQERALAETFAASGPAGLRAPDWPPPSSSWAACKNVQTNSSSWKTDAPEGRKAG